MRKTAEPSKSEAITAIAPLVRALLELRFNIMLHFLNVLRTLVLLALIFAPLAVWVLR
jgi:hypothetical protein